MVNEEKNSKGLKQLEMNFFRLGARSSVWIERLPSSVGKYSCGSQQKVAGSNPVGLGF